ncbi:28088_t:CDS:2, partial [Dentiscutata erythropus]
MSQSPYHISSPLSSPDGTSLSSGLEDEAGQQSLERKLRKELRRRKRELEKEAEARRKERSVTLKKIEEGEEKEEVHFQEWAKKIKQLQEEGDIERQRVERELEEDIIKTRKAREERRRSSSVLTTTTNDPLKSLKRNSMDPSFGSLTPKSLGSPPVNSKIDSFVITKISEEQTANIKIDNVETISNSSLTSEPLPINAKIDINNNKGTKHLSVIEPRKNTIEAVESLIKEDNDSKEGDGITSRLIKRFSNSNNLNPTSPSPSPPSKQQQRGSVAAIIQQHKLKEHKTELDKSPTSPIPKKKVLENWGGGQSFDNSNKDTDVTKSIGFKISPVSKKSDDEYGNKSFTQHKNISDNEINNSVTTSDSENKDIKDINEKKINLKTNSFSSKTANENSNEINNNKISNRINVKIENKEAETPNISKDSQQK